MNFKFWQKSYGKGSDNKRVERLISFEGLFDADFYLRNYSDARSSQLGALDHFIRYGLHENRWPSARFNPHQYAEQNPDVAASELSMLLHYIKYGRKEGRLLPDESSIIAAQLHADGLFDPVFYSKYYLDVAKSDLDPLDHFIRFGISEVRRPSLEFDPKGYLELYPDLSGKALNALVHYARFGKKEGRKLPQIRFDRETLHQNTLVLLNSRLFVVDFYLAKNHEVRAKGLDPIMHYLIEGSKHYQDPSADFSAASYTLSNQELFATGEPPLLHYIRTNSSLNYSMDPIKSSISSQYERTDLVSEQKVTLARMEATRYFSRNSFTFESSGPLTYVKDAASELIDCLPFCETDSQNPDVSIVIPVYGQMPFALSCLDSLCRHKSKFSIEIIVADDNSPDIYETQILGNIPWIRYIRNPENLGFLKNCNDVCKIAKGRFIVLLNSDTRVVNGWLDELIGAFAIFPNAGFIGSKLLNGDGTVQEAGGLYWSDGTPWNYGRGGDERDPRYSFARQVDWVSGASIAIPASIWRDVGGFNEDYSPAYCEDVDLAFRIRDRGLEVWYQPLSQVLHFEGMTHGRDESTGIKAYQVTNLKLLQKQWGSKLPGTRSGGVEPEKEANRSAKKTMLVIDALTHTPDRDAGSAIGWQMLKAFRELGYCQTYIPVHNLKHFGKYTEDYQRVGVEMVYSPFINNIDDLLKTGRSFDYILTHRYNVTTQVIDNLRIHMPTARIIFVPADLHHLRMEREAELNNDRNMKVLAAKAKTEELAIFAKADCSIPHSISEKNVVLSELPLMGDNIVVLPWIIENLVSGTEEGARDDIMFLGGYKHEPNVDAAVFLVEEIWPLIAPKLPLETKLLLVGDSPPARVNALASDRVKITGYVPETEPFFAKARVFVAPLRYGAGVKGKVIQSLANGVPMVATDIAVEGIGLTDKTHCLVANSAEEIAAAVLRLFIEPHTWLSIRQEGLSFIEDHFSWNAALSICERALDTADDTWIHREANARESLLLGLSDELNSRRQATCRQS